MMLRPITQELVTQVIVNQVIELIKQTPLHPGDKLPSEKELMTALNVSRPTVREALRTLNAMGLVESRRGQGSFVSVVRAESAIRPVVLSLLLVGEDAREIQYARKLIESDIVATVVQRATPTDYELVEETLAGMQDALERGESIYELTWDFHRTLAEIAGNSVLTIVLDVLYQMIREIQVKYYEPHIDPKEEIESHRALLKQLEAAAPEEARRLICDHLAKVEDVIYSAMAPGRS